MANLLEDALKRAAKSPGFSEAQETLKKNNVIQSKINYEVISHDPSNAVGDAVKRAAAIKEFEQVRETLKNAGVSLAENASNPTHSIAATNITANPEGLEQKGLDLATRDKILEIQQHGVNNYLSDDKNAVAQVLARQSHPAYKPDRQLENTHQLKL